MPVLADPNVSSDPHEAPVLSREQTRSIRLKIWLWGKQFGSKLQTNAVRMRQFLHGRS